MSLSTLIALVAFAFVTSVTPGPNNIMLMASGANFGFLRSIPHNLGIAIGFFFMLCLLGFGLMEIFVWFPLAQIILKVAAVFYFLWLAWKFANAAPPGEGKAGGKPMTFIQAAAFQWINPKAWMMAIGAITAYAPDRSVMSVVLVGLIFSLVNAPATALWIVLGTEIRRLLNKPVLLRAFNWAMALLLLASLGPVLLH